MGNEETTEQAKLFAGRDDEIAVQANDDACPDHLGETKLCGCDTGRLAEQVEPSYDPTCALRSSAAAGELASMDGHCAVFARHEDSGRLGI